MQDSLLSRFDLLFVLLDEVVGISCLKSFCLYAKGKFFA